MNLESVQPVPRRRERQIRCGSCGSSNVSTSMHTDQFSHGVGSEAVQLSVVVPVRKCADCGEQFTDEEAEVLRHDAVCRHYGLLTPAEIRDIRTRYGKNRAEFAAVTKLGDATLGRWESGATLQNAAYDQYLRLLRFPENIARLSAATGHVGSSKTAGNKLVPFPGPKLRAITQISAELIRDEQAFSLCR